MGATGRRIGFLALAALGWAALGCAGCTGGRTLGPQAQRAYADLTASERAAAKVPAAPAVRVPAEHLRADSASELVLHVSPPVRTASDERLAMEPILMADAGGPSSASAPAPAPAPAPQPATPEKPALAFTSLDGKSFGEIAKEDLRAFPSHLWKGTKESFARPVNLVVLSLAFGADRAVRANWDEDVRDHFRDHRHGSLSETGEFGNIIGHPGTHFAIAGAWYVLASAKGDQKNHDLGYTMLEALTVNGLATMLLKVSMGDRDPAGDRYGWPSGHMSSSVCFASVMHEYYGWQVGVPLYLLSGYVGASRLQDREHDLSDLVFGATLGWVVGHSVARGELPQVAGFQILPYADRGAGGVMLVKQW